MKSALYKSIALHLAAALLIMVDLPFFWRGKDMTLGQVPIIVDLDQIKISDMTNLPAKAEFADETKPASSSSKPEPTFEKAEPKPEPQAADAAPSDGHVSEPEDVASEPKDDFVVPPQPVKPTPKIKPVAPKRPSAPPQPKKPQAPKPAAKNSPKTKPADNMLKNLMDSVNAMEQNLGQNSNATVKTGTQVANMGIEGGSGGSYFSELSITEVDAIASRLRACWNLDPGAMGIEDMIVEIRAYLNRDGTVNRVDILNMSRYSSDRHFKSIAESAKRAVYVCQPYGILSEKYADKYDMWKTMLLRFNPINHSVN